MYFGSSLTRNSLSKMLDLQDIVEVSGAVAAPCPEGHLSDSGTQSKERNELLKAARLMRQSSM